jgi:hypothetical protein
VRRKFRRTISIWSAELPVSDKDFLLYPIDTGEDPVCLGCGTQMTVAAHEVRDNKPDSSASAVRTAGARRSFSWKNDGLPGERSSWNRVFWHRMPRRLRAGRRSFSELVSS